MSDLGTERLRSGQACLGCRKRKNRCDGGRPRCRVCSKRNLECEYAPSSRKELINDGYVASLEAKVRRLERELRSSVACLQPPSCPTPQSSNGNVDANHPPVVISAEVAEDLECDSPGQLQVQPESLDVVEYDQASVQTTIADFGLSPCASSFKRKRTGSDSISDVYRRKTRIGSVIRGREELHSDNYILPTRALASNLVDLFFEHVFPLYPFVHEPTFRKRFAATYGDNPEMDVPWQSTLNLVFAFGCDYLELPPDQIYELSQLFHRRGSELILSVCFDTTTLEVIQALLLLSAHLQSTMQYNRVWTSIGCVIRSAQGLGLHMDPSAWDISTIDKEMRKRVWWGIYALDRFLSLKNGRPPAVTAETLPVGPPTTVDDYCIADAGIVNGQGKRSPSPIHFFNATIQLAHIAETMLVSMFKDAPWCLPGKVGPPKESDPIHMNIQVGHVVEQEGKLSIWLASLPEHLQFGTASGDESVKRQQKMLRIRYLHIRLMSHRPNLLYVIQRARDTTTALEDRFLISVFAASVRQCVGCACEIVTLVKDNTGPKSMGPWWHKVQFLYTALSTLFAVRSQPSVSDYIDEDTINSTINMALEYLDQLGDVTPVAAKCRKYFASLKVWAESKSSPLDATILGDIGVPSSVYRQMTGEDTIRNTTEGSFPTNNDNIADTGSNEVLYNPVSDLFLEPLLPDLYMDLFN